MFTSFGLTSPLFSYGQPLPSFTLFYSLFLFSHSFTHYLCFYLCIITTQAHTQLSLLSLYVCCCSCRERRENTLICLHFYFLLDLNIFYNNTHIHFRVDFSTYYTCTTWTLDLDLNNSQQLSLNSS